MKHDMKVTQLLVVIFVLSQFFGLILLAIDAQVFIGEDGLVVGYEETAIGERPDFEGLGSLLYLTIGVGVGTLLLLMLIRLRFGKNIWKVWYGLAVLMAITLSLGVLFSNIVAFLLAVLLTYLKMTKRNMVSHNLTEILMYSGLAVLLVPLFNIFWATMMLIVISIYDIIAVWKSKHMVKLAEFTTESNLFAGLLVNYEQKKGKTVIHNSTAHIKKPTGKKKVAVKGKTAILGGGDIVFPLLFTGTVLTWLLGLGYTKLLSLVLSMIVTVTTTAALALLFIYAKKDKFYPAMPFISAGCFSGLIVLLTVLLLL